MRRVVPSATILLLLPLFVTACRDDPAAAPVRATRIVQVTATSAATLPGRSLPAHSDTTVIWLANDRVRRDAAGRSFVLRADAGRLIVLDHAGRTALDLSLREAGEYLAGLAAAPDSTGRPRDRRLRDLVRIAARVTDTGQTATIDGRPCRRYVVELRMGDTEVLSEQWTTEAFGVDESLLQRASTLTLAGLPGAAEALAELARVRGLPVRATSVTRLNDSEIRAETRLAAVDTVEVAAGWFDAPADYLPAAPPNAGRPAS